MNKILLLPVFVLLSYGVQAQRIQRLTPEQLAWTYPSMNGAGNVASDRTTAVGDTLVLKHTVPTDSFTLYRSGADSGYVTGTDIWGDKAFAEQYVFNGYDTSVQVIGLYALFGGKVSATSTRSLTLSVWGQDLSIPITSTLLYNGFPGQLLDTLTVPVTSIGLGATVDTLKRYMFATPTSFLSGNFFVGYSINYQFGTLNGDTLGLACTRNGVRLPVDSFTLVYNTDTTEPSVDTVINVQNATLGADNSWYDNYSQNDQLYNNLVVYPIVVIGHSTVGTAVVKRNNLSFWGNYPNPADGETTIRYQVANGAAVQIEVTDCAGRTVRQLNPAKAGDGVQEVRLQTADLPSGDYIYLLRAGTGEGIAARLTVVHTK